MNKKENTTSETPMPRSVPAAASGIQNPASGIRVPHSPAGRVSHLPVFITLLLATFSLSYVLGMMQFFLVERMVAVNGEGSRDAVIQIISAFVTGGTVGAYFLSGPLTAAFRKRHVMFTAAVLAALLFLIGSLMDWKPNPWMYLFIMGMLLGAFNAAKMASVPLVAGFTGLSVTAVNAGATVVFLVGLLTGFPSGTWLYSKFPQQGFALPVGILLLSGIFGLFCKYPNESRRNFVDEERRIFGDTADLFRKHWLFLVSGPILWGVASAAQSAAVALVVRDGLASKIMAACIPVWAALGSVLGTFISPWFARRRYWNAAVCAAVMTVTLPFFPHIAVTYIAIAIAFAVLGLFFGVATNLIDAGYLEIVGTEGKEGQGAALQSAMISFSMVASAGTVGLSVQRDWIAPDTQFPILAGFSVLTVVLAIIIARRGGR